MGGVSYLDCLYGLVMWVDVDKDGIFGDGGGGFV